jgi:hypothetical protein
MELRFPESSLNKVQAAESQIKKLERKIGSEKPAEVWRPGGVMEDCSGCGQPSGKHIGGPCNYCKSNQLKILSEKKFAEVSKKLQEANGPKPNISNEEKEFKERFNKEMNLDENYAKKFGMLKKACVLYSYGRFNDAFHSVSEAA